MDRRLYLIIPLAILVIACGTCTTTGIEPSTPSQGGGGAAPSGGGGNPGDFQFYSDSSGKEGSQIDSFPTTQHKLHFKTKVDPLNKGQKVRWIFTAVSAGNLQDKEVGRIEMDVPIDGVNVLNAALSNDSDWPAGSYKVELYIDGNLLKSGEFQIVSP